MLRSRVALSRTTRTIPTGQLPKPAYNIPATDRFAAERSGEFNPKWLAAAPQFKEVLRAATYVPPLDDMWGAPTHEALQMVADSTSYYDLGRYAAEHGYYFLFRDMLLADDAPLPHVVYEDLMQNKTFGSFQDVPEKQFAMDDDQVRLMMALCAHHVALDPGYFQQVERLFKRLEQQQQLTSPLLSGWFWCCTAAGETDAAVTYLQFMEQHKVRFDANTFSLMMHPSSSPRQHARGNFEDKTKGMLLQQRLCQRMQAEGTAAVGVHAAMVFYSLGLNHAKKWELLQRIAAAGVAPSQRTVDLIMSIFNKEKGRRCGPKSYRGLVEVLAEAGRCADVVKVLFNLRKRELLPEHVEEPEVVFAERTKVKVMDQLRLRAGEEEHERHAPLVFGLMANHKRPDSVRFIKKAAEIARARREEEKQLAAERAAAAAKQLEMDAPPNAPKEDVDEGVSQSAVVPVAHVSVARTQAPKDKSTGKPSALETLSRSQSHSASERPAAVPVVELDEVPIVPYMSPKEHRDAVRMEAERATKDVQSFHRLAEERNAQQRETAALRRRMHSAWINLD